MLSCRAKSRLLTGAGQGDPVSRPPKPHSEGPPCSECLWFGFLLLGNTKELFCPQFGACVFPQLR